MALEVWPLDIQIAFEVQLLDRQVAFKVQLPPSLWNPCQPSDTKRRTVRTSQLLPEPVRQGPTTLPL